ncbi:hypothetical protein LBMAG42_27770 [Deltaproteobacteria bacterium]|nr:hypothetical protein LBMAG42_27770 [Deltaproteobacteria bacterium]
MSLFQPASPAAALGKLAPALDWWRAAPLTAPGGALEWMHFVIVGQGLRLLVNLSLRREAGEVRPRVVVLLWSGGVWSGGIHEPRMRDVEVRAGGVDAFFGASFVRSVGGDYVLHLDPADTGVAGDFVLRPEAAPLLATNLKLPDSGRFHWVSVPRLSVVSGELRLPHAVSLTGCTAYHDHNWGSFDFGGDFAWEWSFGLPASPLDPWSLMALRVSDRARHRTLVAGLAVWRDGQLWRDFRNAEVEFSRSGRWAEAPPHRLPALDPDTFEALGSPPLTASWHGRDGSDWIDVVGSTESSAQLILPAGGRLVVLSELPSRLRVLGSLRGRSVDCGLLGMLEVVDG